MWLEERGYPQLARLRGEVERDRKQRADSGVAGEKTGQTAHPTRDGGKADEGGGFDLLRDTGEA